MQVSQAFNQDAGVLSESTIMPLRKSCHPRPAALLDDLLCATCACVAAPQATVSPRGELLAIIDPVNKQSAWVMPLLGIKAHSEGPASPASMPASPSAMPPGTHRFSSSVVLDKRGKVGPELFTCLAWSADESRLLLAGHSGSLYLLDRSVCA